MKSETYGFHSYDFERGSEQLRRDEWKNIEIIAHIKSWVRRPVAHYMDCKLKVLLYGAEYRAIVIPSSPQDKRK